MNAWEKLNLDIKAFYLAGIGSADSPELKKLQDQLIDDVQQLIDPVREVLYDHRRRVIMLALAFLLSEQLDSIMAQEKEKNVSQA